MKRRARQRFKAFSILLGLLSVAASAPAVAGPKIMAVGDIACSPGVSVTATKCRYKATSDLVMQAAPVAVLTMGDNQYEQGRLEDFNRAFAPTWGRFLTKIKPTPGNHEYETSGARGYYDYFGSRAGVRGKGYYSFNVGDWHIVALNSNIARGTTSPQLEWLRKDLTSNDSKCTMAYWHHSRFSSGAHGDDPSVAAFWNVLYADGADVVLNGHDHNYERFAPQNPSGRMDTARGITEFVVGTGGKELRPFRQTIKPNSRARNHTVHGVLQMELLASSFKWRFVPEAGKNFADAGTASCH